MNSLNPPKMTSLIALLCFPSLFQRHRVSIPEEECQRRVPRRSVAFFVHPDDDTIIKCLDGSEKYPSITAYDYQWERLNATYEYE